MADKIRRDYIELKLDVLLIEDIEARAEEAGARVSEWVEETLKEAMYGD